MAAKKGCIPWNKGRTGLYTKEAKQKMSLAHLGKKSSEESRKKVSLTLKGHPVSDETKEKLRQAMVGKHHTEETKEKLRNYIRTEEHKQKLRESQLGRHHSEETKQKIRASAPRGENNFNWKGGRKLSGNGYIAILKPEHPYSTKSGYVMEHRLVMEQHIDRYLYSWEMVHHVNGIKTDNRIENLKLLPGIEHNTQVQKVYQENLQLKQRILELESQLLTA